MSPLDPLNEIGYMPPPSNLEDQIQLTPTIFGAPIKVCTNTYFPLTAIFANKILGVPIPDKFILQSFPTIEI